MISICDIKKNDGKIEVVGQRDFIIPDFSDIDIADLCHDINCNCNCGQCVIFRITEGRGSEE